MAPRATEDDENKLWGGQFCLQPAFSKGGPGRPVTGFRNPQYAPLWNQRFTSGFLESRLLPRAMLALREPCSRG